MVRNGPYTGVASRASPRRTSSTWWLAPRRTTAVRPRYGPTLDRREAAALDQVLAGCTSTELSNHVRTGRGPDSGDALGPRPRGDRRVGRRPERPRQMRGKLDGIAARRTRSEAMRTGGLAAAGGDGHAADLRGVERRAVGDRRRGWLPMSRRTPSPRLRKRGMMRRIAAGIALMTFGAVPAFAQTSVSVAVRHATRAVGTHDVLPATAQRLVIGTSTRVIGPAVLLGTWRKPARGAPWQLIFAGGVGFRIRGRWSGSVALGVIFDRPGLCRATGRRRIHTTAVKGFRTNRTNRTNRAGEVAPRGNAVAIPSGQTSGAAGGADVGAQRGSSDERRTSVLRAADRILGKRACNPGGFSPVVAVVERLA